MWRLVYKGLHDARSSFVYFSSFPLEVATEDYTLSSLPVLCLLSSRYTHNPPLWPPSLLLSSGSSITSIFLLIIYPASFFPSCPNHSNTNSPTLPPSCLSWSVCHSNMLILHPVRPCHSHSASQHLIFRHLRRFGSYS